MNPSETASLTFTLDGQYQKVIPQGGGLILTNGNWEGSLEYETVSGTIELRTISGVILLNSNSTQSVMHPTDNIGQLRSSRNSDAINPLLFFSHDSIPVPNEIVSLNEIKISTRLRTPVVFRMRDIVAY